METITKQIEDKISSNQLILPTIPESLVRIRKALDDPDISIAEIANVIAADPSLAAKILKVSNSASYQRSGKPIENLQNAVTRLGNKLIQTLTVNHALVQIFAKSHGITGKWISLLQNHSLNVAAQAYALAKHFTRINPDDALLAGLLHNIGYLPLLQASEELPGIDEIEDPRWLSIRDLHKGISVRILENWHLPESIIHVAREHDNFSRENIETVDMVDIIIVAQLSIPRIEAALGFDHVPSPLASATRLGFSSLQEIKDQQEIQKDFVQAYELLTS